MRYWADDLEAAISLNSEVEIRDTALNNVGQAFQSAGSPDFPVRPGATGKSPQLADKMSAPRKQPAASLANFGIQDKYLAYEIL